MKSAPYAIAIDGSNDNGVEKMNPLTVRFFNECTGMVTTQLLDMCLTSGICIYWHIQFRFNCHCYFYVSGVNSGTAETIFNKMDETLLKNGVSWDKCIGLGVDNTSVNMGKRNSIRTRVLAKNPSVYIMGCPCHIVHNTAMKASASFQAVGIGC